MQRQTNEKVMREQEEEEKHGTSAEGGGDNASNVNSLVNGTDAPQTSSWGSWFSWSYD